MKRGKKAQIQISFSMIFSIILIIAFVALAIYAITKFLDIKKCSQIGLFKEDLQDSIDKLHSSDGGSDVFEKSLPSSIKEICFVDISKSYNKEEAVRYLALEHNFFFFPLESSCEGLESFEIKNINIEKITERKNPYCVVIEKGKVSLKIEKGIYDSSVCIDCSGSSSSDNSGNIEDRNKITGFCGVSMKTACQADNDCKAGGCSGQVCEGKNENTITTCEYKDCFDAEKYNLKCKCVDRKCQWN